MNVQNCKTVSTIFYSCKISLFFLLGSVYNRQNTFSNTINIMDQQRYYVKMYKHMTI